MLVLEVFLEVWTDKATYSFGQTNYSNQLARKVTDTAKYMANDKCKRWHTPALKFTTLPLLFHNIVVVSTVALLALLRIQS